MCQCVYQYFHGTYIGILCGIPVCLFAGLNFFCSILIPVWPPFRFYAGILPSSNYEATLVL